MKKKKKATKKSAAHTGLRRVDLARVADRAMHDRDFFEALKDDPAAALQEVGWSLDPSDLDFVTQAMAGHLVAVDFNAVDFIQEVLDTEACLNPWKPAWRKIDPPPSR